MIIYLVRHARPHEVEGICYGRQEVTVAVSENEQAARAAGRQIPSNVLKSAPIFSSPLERCTMLAREIAGGRAVTVSPALLELDFGAWQGHSWDAIPRGELDSWADDLWRYAPGQGESAEAAALRWRAWADPQRHNSGAVIAVTHAGLIRVAHAAESSDPTLLTMDVRYGSVYPIDLQTRRSTSAALKQALP